MALWTRRVTFAFEQCLLCLGHHPDVWYEYAVFLQEAAQLMTDKGVSGGGEGIRRGCGGGGGAGWRIGYDRMCWVKGRMGD